MQIFQILVTLHNLLVTGFLISWLSKKNVRILVIQASIGVQ